MNKIIITLISVVVITSAIITGIIIFSPKEDEQNIQVAEVKEENIIDDCTEEYEASKIIETNAENEEKISPNASITIRKYYTDCGHTTSEYKTIPAELVNKTQKELEKIYNGYEVIKFTDTDIVLEKQENGNCNEHYIVKDKDGKVAIYEVQLDGTEKEYEVTDISTEYLTATDRNNIEKGIEVNGKQNLNQLIEDFE